MAQYAMTLTDGVDVRIVDVDGNLLRYTIIQSKRQLRLVRWRQKDGVDMLQVNLGWNKLQSQTQRQHQRHNAIHV